MTRKNSSTVLFDTGEKANPSRLTDHFLFEAWDDKVSVLVLKSDKTGGLSLILDHADHDESDLKTHLSVTADQTNRYLGTYTVVGVQTFDGRRFGEVPNRKLTAKVQK